MLCCHHPLIHIDEAVFGADATEFKPKRFIGNPGLKDDVSVFPAAVVVDGDNDGNLSVGSCCACSFFHVLFWLELFLRGKSRFHPVCGSMNNMNCQYCRIVCLSVSILPEAPPLRFL